MKKQNIQSKKSPNQVYCKIADHLMGVYCPEQLDIKIWLPNFAPFIVEKPADNKDIVWVEIRTSGLDDDQEEKRLLSNTSAQWGDRFRFEESGQAYITSVRGEGREQVWKMVSTKDFQQSVIYAAEAELCQGTILNWLLMVVYGQAVIQYKTMLIHASVIKMGGLGFAFLGKSGTGKSTHSRLWLEHIAGSCLLNDDNPVVRINEQGKVWIYGSPWSGKTPCYHNVGVELAGVVRLKQAKHNQWISVSAKEALLTLLPSCTSIRWNRKLFAKMVDIVEEVAAKVPVAHLACLPNGEAAYLCREKLTAANAVHK